MSLTITLSEEPQWGFLILGIIDVLHQTILCCGSFPVHLSCTSGPYLPEANSTLP